MLPSTYTIFKIYFHLEINKNYHYSVKNNSKSVIFWFEEISEIQYLIIAHLRWGSAYLFHVVETHIINTIRRKSTIKTFVNSYVKSYTLIHGWNEWRGINPKDSDSVLPSLLYQLQKIIKPKFDVILNVRLCHSKEKRKSCMNEKCAVDYWWFLIYTRFCYNYPLPLLFLFYLKFKSSFFILDYLAFSHTHSHFFYWLPFWTAVRKILPLVSII